MTRQPRGVAMSAALDDADVLLEQAVSVLRAWPAPADLERWGVDDPADLPVGAADRALLDVVEAATGHRLEHTVACPSCAAPTTLPLGRADVGEHHPRSAWCGPGAGAREPTYADLLAAGDDLGRLLERCCTGTGGTLDDLARTEGSLSGPLRSGCLSCGSPVVVDVDVVALALRELDAVRSEVDVEVHLLAASYGWDLQVIESLPDARRRRLAGLIAGGSL